MLVSIYLTPLIGILNLKIKNHILPSQSASSLPSLLANCSGPNTSNYMWLLSFLCINKSYWLHLQSRSRIWLPIIIWPADPGLSKGTCSSLSTVLSASFLCCPIYSPCRPYLTNLSSPLHSASIYRLEPSSPCHAVCFAFFAGLCICSSLSPQIFYLVVHWQSTQKPHPERPSEPPTSPSTLLSLFFFIVLITPPHIIILFTFHLSFLECELLKHR